MDYCSQLWMPTKSTQIGAIEKLQKDFLNKVPALKDLNYWVQLKKLKMLSLQRRLKRYRIIYTWIVLKGIVPNCGMEVKNESGRNGKMYRIPNISTHGRKSV